MKQAEAGAPTRTRSPSPVRRATRRCPGARPARLPVGRAPPRPAASSWSTRPSPRSAGTAPASAWTRSPPRPAPARPSSTGTSPTAPSSTSPSATGSPRSCCPSCGPRSRAAHDPRADGRRRDRDLSGVPRGRPRAVPVRRPPADARPADQPTRSAACPTSSASRRPRLVSVALQQAGRDPAAAAPWGHGVVGLVRSAADWWLRADRPMLRSELAAHLTDLAWAGLSGVVTRHPSSNKEERDHAPCPPRSTRRHSRRSWTGDGRTCAGTPARTCGDPDFAPVYGETVQEARERVTRLAKKLADSGRVGLGFPKEYGGEDDSGGSVTSIEMLAFGDLSLMVKAGVQWGLFGGAAAAARHQAPARQVPARRHELRPARLLRDDRDRARLRRPAAAHDVHVRPGDRRCFDLHTPHQAARKDYIGNAAKDGRMAVVFAQLITQGKNHGVHAWLVPIRDEDGDPMPGVTIGDDGPKAGLNGVDNGRLTFDHVHGPARHAARPLRPGRRGRHLHRRASRTRPAASSPCSARSCAAGSASAARRRSATKLALDIAVRYGDVRRQFAAPGDDREIVINDYLVHQRKLLPALATTYALHFAQGELVETMHDVQTAVHAQGEEVDEEAQRELESRAAGLKVGPDLARDADDPDVPRGLRRRRLPAGEPAAAPQGRHRRLHHVRGRQHRPAAAGREGPAHRLPRHVRLAGRAGARSASSPTWCARRCWSGRRPAR